MHYYIDGYNYMFRYYYAEDDLQEKRQRLLADLNAKVKLLKLDVTIVFDAQYEPSSNSRTHFDALEVIFTSHGEIADEFILQALKIASFPAMQTVVTSDKKLYSQAKRLHAQAETVELFIEKLHKRYQNKIRRLEHPKPSKKIQEQQAIQALMAKPPPDPQKKQHKPSSKALLGECFDYYLEVFERRFREEQK
jgi:uncharacterized protein